MNREVFNYNSLELIYSNREYLINKFNDESYRQILEELLTPECLVILSQFKSVHLPLYAICAVTRFIINEINCGYSNDGILKYINNIKRKIIGEDGSIKRTILLQDSVLSNLLNDITDDDLLNDIINISRNVSSVNEYYCKFVELLFEKTMIQEYIIEMIEIFIKEDPNPKNSFSRSLALLILKYRPNHSKSELEYIKVFERIMKKAIIME